jgi:hypothetical protein
VYLAKELPEAESFRTQGTWHYGVFTLNTNEVGRCDLRQVFDDPWIDARSDEYPFATVVVSSANGTSEFSHLSPAPEITDIAVHIDTNLSKVESNGRVTIQATIMNLGGNPATTVAVRDTTSNFDLESVTISKGVALIADSTFVATIPSLAFGEVIEYKAIGKARAIGPHLRRVYAIPSENDVNVSNNFDTIQLIVTGISSVNSVEAEKIKITASGRVATLTGLANGHYIIRSHDLLGRNIGHHEVTVSGDAAVEFYLETGVNLIDITRQGLPYYQAKLILSDR